MREELSRTALLIGEESTQKLISSSVLVFGVGGVGGYVVEALARSGVGRIGIVDSDVVSPSNINRQIIATKETVGRKKVEAMKERILSINPSAVVDTYEVFYLPETAEEIDFTLYDYIVDAIDTVKGKVAIVKRANEYNVPVISSMGTGNKLDPTKFEVAELSKTTVCPLARAMRRELKGQKLKVVYSKEEPHTPSNEGKAPASISFVPSVAGLILAGEVIKDLIK